MVSRSSSRNSGVAVCGAIAVLGGFSLAGCRTVPPPAPALPPTSPKPAPPVPPVPVARQGDEIIVAGQPFHTGTRVITWMDPGGYNAYQFEHPVAPPAAGKPVRSHPAAPAFVATKPFGRREALAGASRGDLGALQRVVDQFVLHYDGAGLSKICFEVLQQRGLSVHFLLDLDGTVYQTLDLEERALHATTSNERSIGIEMANVGAYPRGETRLLTEWYHRDAQGQTQLRVPAKTGDPGIHKKNFTGRPARPAAVRGVVQGKELIQYDFTPEQYEALTRLTVALCRLFPRIRCDYPHDLAGQLITRKLPDKELAHYEGILGHFHIQENKTDPGPAFQWDTFIAGVRQQLLSSQKSHRP
jgi:N-acetylmuramoyl-L-alanine amidase